MADEVQDPQLPLTPNVSPPDPAPAPSLVDPPITGGPELFVTAADLAAEKQPDVNWIVQGYVARGGISLYDGPPKAAGKTTHVMHLVGAVVEGRPFLDRPTMRTPVVYVTEEHASTFRRRQAQAGVNSSDLHVLLRRKVAGISFADIVDRVLEKCRITGAKLVVIDTLAQFAPGIDSAPARVSEVFSHLRKISDEDIAVIGTRHTRKSGGPVGVSGRGSSAGTAAADIIVAIERIEGHTGHVRQLRALSRFDETPESCLVELTDNGYAVLDRMDGVALNHEAEILAALPTDEAGALAAETIVAAAQLTKTVGREALTRLTEVGKVVRIGAGVRGDPARYYRAA
jgi:hypothetical protein